MRGRNIIVRLLYERDGAAAAYVALISAAMVGIVGLVIDIGRLSAVTSQAQMAADAAALAAASQLNQEPTAFGRATLAAVTQPLVTNRRTLEDGIQKDAPEISVQKMRFLRRLPPDGEPITADCETTEPIFARFVEVTTVQQSHTNWFLPAIGAPRQVFAAARAVAGRQLAVCRMQPLWICNPWETSTNSDFSIDVARGRMVLAKTKGGGAGMWAPGDFGVVEPPLQFQSKIKDTADEIARVAPQACYGDTIDARSGQVNGVTEGLNVRFDMYDGAFSSKRTDGEYRPARNVTKGMVANSGDPCNMTTSAAAKALPRDTCLLTGRCTGSEYPKRIGDGVWDRAEYWKANHSSPLPAALKTATRYQVYRYEIDNNMIPSSGASPEIGAPRCYKGSPAANDDPDRRIIYIAVINCQEQGPLNGKRADRIPVKTFVKAFVTEPATPDGDVWLEFVDLVREEDRLLQPRVQLYR